MYLIKKKLYNSLRFFKLFMLIYVHSISLHLIMIFYIYSFYRNFGFLIYIFMRQATYNTNIYTGLKPGTKTCYPLLNSIYENEQSPYRCKCASDSTDPVWCSSR